MSLTDTLTALGYKWVQLPVKHPTHPLLIASRRGDIVTTSGQIPFKRGVIALDNIVAGKVGRRRGDISPKDAANAAELAALQCLYAAGSIVTPDQIVGVDGMDVLVNCAPGFNDTSSVANGASQFMIKLFGEANGLGTRIATGASELPMDAAVEIVTRFVVR